MQNDHHDDGLGNSYAARGGDRVDRSTPLDGEPVVMSGMGVMGSDEQGLIHPCSHAGSTPATSTRADAGANGNCVGGVGICRPPYLFLGGAAAQC
jgi:hypothetical protein